MEKFARQILRRPFSRFLFNYHPATSSTRAGTYLTKRYKANDVMIDETRLDQLLEREATAFAMKPRAPVVLQEVIGILDSARMAMYLHDEVPARLAARVAQCEELDGWEEIQGIVVVREKMMRSFKDLRLVDPHDIEQISEVIRNMKQRHRNAVPLLAGGLREYQAKIMPTMSNAAVNAYLDRFFMDRIGVEMLTSQFLALLKNNTGIIDQQCDPTRVCKVAAEAAQVMSRQAYSKSPLVTVEFHGPENLKTFAYVPTYLYYVVHEILKNAVRATVENHTGAGKMHPVHVSVCTNEDQLVIEIRDAGGGIATQDQKKIWNYLYTTVPNQDQKLEFILNSENVEESNKFTPIAGFGVGLPLSKLYASFLGGSLKLINLPNYGVAAYLTLSRHAAEQDYSSIDTV